MLLPILVGSTLILDAQITVQTFRDSIENVIHLQGRDYKKAYVPKSAQKVLKRWDKTAAHFTAVEKRFFR